MLPSDQDRADVINLLMGWVDKVPQDERVRLADYLDKFNDSCCGCGWVESISEPLRLPPSYYSQTPSDAAGELPEWAKDLSKYMKDWLGSLPLWIRNHPGLRDCLTQMEGRQLTRTSGVELQGYLHQWDQ